MADDLLYRCAERILTEVVAALDDPPSRTYVAAAEPTDSCAHVAVWLRELAPAVKSSARGGQQPPMPTVKTSQSTGRFVVQFLRDCYPVFDGTDLPAPATISAAAELVLTDRQDVWAALRSEAREGTLFAGILAHGGDGVEVQAPQTVSPQSGGGLMGSRIELFVHLLRHEGGGS